MKTSLRAIAKKAAEQRKYRFGDLYRLLNEENLRWSFFQLRRNAACGVDQTTWREYEQNLEENLSDLVDRLKQKRYRAWLVRRKHIPKPGGKKRPLGIPALEDKILQVAVANILSAIFEQEFLDCSYGYRRKRGAHDAIRGLQRELWNRNLHWVVEADVRKFFEQIDHDWMVRMLAERVDDRALIGLIKKWLKAGVLEEDGRIEHPATGSPQGGVVSPVLANIYLHYVLDLWFEKRVKRASQGEAVLYRYADDFVAAFEEESDARKVWAELSDRLKKFGLETAEEKTRVLKFSRRGGQGNGRFDFLGFEFLWRKSRKGRPYVLAHTSRKKLEASVRNFTEWIRTHRDQKVRRVLKKLRRKLARYRNYYGLPGNSVRLGQFRYRITRVLFKWLNRRSQRRSYTWSTFNRLLNRHGIGSLRIRPQPATQLELGLEIPFLIW